MKRTLYQLSMWGLLLLTGCNDPKHVTDTLTCAEALMNEYPDSAWAVLNTLSPDDMGQSRTRALYALLYTQQDVCFYAKTAKLRWITPSLVVYIHYQKLKF